MFIATISMHSPTPLEQIGKRSILKIHTPLNCSLSFQVSNLEMLRDLSQDPVPLPSSRKRIQEGGERFSSGFPDKHFFSFLLRSAVGWFSLPLFGFPPPPIPRGGGVLFVLFVIKYVPEYRKLELRNVILCRELFKLQQGDLLYICPYAYI